MIISRRPIMLILTLAVLTVVGGCASTPAGPDVTGGLSMGMFVQLEEEAFAAYRVVPDGTLSFAGGQDALDREYSWSGPMTEEEIAALTALIEESGWFESDPASTYAPPQRTYEIWLARAGDKKSSRRFKVHGDGPGVRDVYKLLETAAQRRNDALLKSLPRPGDQTP